MSAFYDKNFYPTPLPVIERMIAGLELNRKTVLEPSAGSGNIVNAVKKLGAEAKGFQLPKSL